MKKRLIALLVVTLMLALSTMPVLALEPPEEKTIADIVTEAANWETDPEFTILAAALEAAGLMDALAAPGSFTVFAPTDEAFLAFLSAAGLTAEELLAHPFLAEVLLYHVLNYEEPIMSTDLQEGSQGFFTMQGEVVEIIKDADDIMVNDANVTDWDIIATNGVIHIIDGVLAPELNTLGHAIVMRALGDPPQFTVLYAALEATDLLDELFKEGYFTVFAPTDVAFAILLEELEMTAEELLAHPQLDQVLLYHLVEGLYMSGDLSDGQLLTTAQGDDLLITVDSVENEIWVNQSLVVEADVEFANGVVHVISTVLVPEGFVFEEEVEIAPTGQPAVHLAFYWTIVGLALLSFAGWVVARQKK